MSDQKRDGTPRGQEEVSKKVLGSLGRSFTSDATINWLKNLSEDVSPAESIAVQSAEPPYMTVLSCVDTIFDHFQRYAFAYEYNRSEQLNVADMMEVQCERPDFTRTTDSKVKFRGHIATDKWALVIVAEAEKILAYMMKLELVEMFDLRREHYQPFLEVYATESERGLIWKAEGQTLYFEHLSFIAKKLFARLVRVSKGEASELEPFKIEIPEPNAPRRSVLGQTLNRIRYAAATDNSDQVLRETMDRTDNALTELICMLEQDLQEFTKMGIMALRSGNSELQKKLSERTKMLTELTRDLKPLIEHWRESSSACKR